MLFGRLMTWRVLGKHRWILLRNLRTYGLRIFGTFWNRRIFTNFSTLLHLLILFFILVVSKCLVEVSWILREIHFILFYNGTLFIRIVTIILMKTTITQGKSAFIEHRQILIRLHVWKVIWAFWLHVSTDGRRIVVVVH